MALKPVTLTFTGRYAERTPLSREDGNCFYEGSFSHIRPF
jgi:hypothetical protein